MRNIDDIKDEYYEWLTHLVGIRDHQALFSYLHNSDFYWSVERDVNRALDGIGLRDKFMRIAQYDIADTERFGACTILEMLLGLAIRMNDIMYEIGENDRTSHWFWLLLRNTGLDNCYDKAFYADGVDAIITTVLSRNYDYNGIGGFFPLHHCEEDQRNVELFYQMSAYLDENYSYINTN